MEVFKAASKRYGGPLSIGEYMSPSIDKKSNNKASNARAAAAADTTVIDRKTLFDAVLSDQDFSLVATLLLGGARVDAARGVDGATPLHVAAAGTVRCPLGTEEIIHNRHPINNSGNNNRGIVERLDPPCRNKLIMNFLIDNGADVNAAGRIGGETPLMVACAFQNVTAARLLLARGASVEARDGKGRTCLVYAALYPHVMMTLAAWVGEVQLGQLAREAALLHQVCRVPGSRFPALYLIEQLGMDVNAFEVSGTTATSASGSNNSNTSNGDAYGAGGGEVHVPLIADGAAASTIKAPLLRGIGPTPLHCAVEAGDLQLVIALLANGANPAAISSDPSAGASVIDATTTTTGGGGSFMATNTNTNKRNSATATDAAATTTATPLALAELALSAEVAIMMNIQPMWSAALSFRASSSSSTSSGGSSQLESSSSSRLSPVRGFVLRAMSVLVAAAIRLRVLNVETAAQSQWQRSPVARFIAIRSLLKTCLTAAGEEEGEAASASASAALLHRMDNPSSVQSLSGDGGCLVRLAASAEVCIGDLADLAAFTHLTGAVFLAAAPHLGMLLLAELTGVFACHLLAACVLLAAFINVKRVDENLVGSRPLRTFGFVLGMIITQLIMALKHNVVYWDNWMVLVWLVPSLAVAGASAAWVMLVSPGTIASTAGQRKGIYASLSHAKKQQLQQQQGNSAGGGGDGGGISFVTDPFPKELIFSVDLPAMVRKPLRSHRCPHSGRVVLRYDHYSGYLAAPIGARNHRALLLCVASLLSFFLCAYAMARAERTRVAKRYHNSNRHQWGGYDEEREEHLSFGRWRDNRMPYMYCYVLLPVTLFIISIELYTQFFAIMRNVTAFDLEHGATDSSLYCFLLGERVYSLFDGGYWTNLADFFLFRADYSTVVYRVPQMSAELRTAVEEYQRWQVAGSGDCGCSHGDDNGGGGGGESHGHSHGGGGGGGNPAMQRQQAMLDQAVQNAIATTATASSPEGHQREETAVALAAPVASTANNNGAAAATVPSVAQYIFQEMIRSGTADIGIATYYDSTSNNTSANGNGIATQTQQEWAASVEQAKHMFSFFQTSLVATAQSSIQERISEAEAAKAQEAEEGHGHSH